jgi:hypothetical protein
MLIKLLLVATWRKVKSIAQSLGFLVLRRDSMYIKSMYQHIISPGHLPPEKRSDAKILSTQAPAHRLMFSHNSIYTTRPYHFA